MQQFESEFPKVGEEELREQCSNTVQEYEESMRVWKEMKETGDVCTSDTDSEEEDELTSEDLLRTLNKMSAAANPAATHKAESSNIDWPKRVLRQTILLSRIAEKNRSRHRPSRLGRELLRGVPHAVAAGADAAGRHPRRSGDRRSSGSGV